ncbi:MAG: hypothetical protein DMG22_01845 [Acidobacteria bacterium]|nr:MAG: hypothetical protein DMG22_01845 [Acidobacteriota bacterium]
MKPFATLVLSIVLIGMALDFGGVQPAGYNLGEIVLFLTMLLFLVSQTRAGVISLPLPIWPFLFTGWVALEIIPFPAGLVKALDPARDFSPTLGPSPLPASPFLTLSLYPHDTIAALLKFLLYVTAFVIAALVFDSRKGKSGLLRALVALGCFEAVYGIIQVLTGWQNIFSYAKQFDRDDATGTYINHNHFAGMLELVLPFLLALANYSHSQLSGRSGAWRNPLNSGSDSPHRFQWLYYLFLAGVMGLAIILSHSKAGMLSILFVVIGLAFLVRLQGQRKASVLGVLIFGMIAVGFGIWTGLAPVLARFRQLEEAGFFQRADARLSIWKDALHLLGDYRWTGTGLGTFGVAFLRYQTTMTASFVDHAHNDFLELATETGWIGALLVFGPIVYLLFRMVYSFLDDSHRYRRAVTLGCIGAVLGLLTYSVTDFNLEIPANALAFAMILGIGYKAACIERSGESSH